MGACDRSYYYKLDDHIIKKNKKGRRLATNKTKTKRNGCRSRCQLGKEITAILMEPSGCKKGSEDYERHGELMEAVPALPTQYDPTSSR